MKYSNSIEYNISTKLDKSGLTQLQTQIKQVELTMQQMANKELLNPTKVQNAREQLQGLSTALNKAFNPSLGMLDLAQFRKELSNSKVTAEGLQSAFRLTGAQGAQAFSSLAKQIGHFNSGMERTSSAVDKMFVTFSNTFRWGLISSFFSQFMNAIHQSVQYAKDLDDSLTQIMLVTDYNRDSMNEYAKAANEAAKAVGQTTVGMTNASLIFAQQGYDLDQSQQLATLSAKLANASQQDTAATSDQITAYMNAYGLQNSMDELVQAMDNWAKIANISAADVEEIALASQRAASMANAVGVSGEALAAQIATIESVTREAPEQIGNGLKTLYARFSDLKFGKDDEDGIGLGKVTSTLQQIGVQVLDAFGNVRDMDDIMEDLMVVWQDLDDTSKTAAAQALAGKHQVNRFMALMENVDMYQEYKGATGASASGTLEEMNTEYLDSLQGRMTKLQSTLEGLFNDIFTTDMVYPLIDKVTKLAEAIDMLFDSIGDGPTIILGLVSAFTQLFSKNIARSINDFISNQQLAETRKSNLANVKGALADTGLDQTEVGQYIDAGAERAGAMNAEQYRIYEQQLDSYIIASKNAAAANEKLNDTYLTVAAAAGMLYDNAEDLIVLDETGLNISGLIDEVSKKNPKELAESFKSIDWKPAIEGAEELSKSMGRLSIAIDKTKKDGQDLDIALQAWDKADDNLTILYETGAITKQTYEKLQGVLSSTAEKLEDTGTVEGKVKEEFEQATAVIARYTEALKNIGPETLAKGPEAVAKALRDQLAAQQALEQNGQASNGIIKNLDMQNFINSVVTAVGALQQLGFGIQSLQNLGSILNNKDISDSEKLLKVIINLSTAVPSIVFAFKTLKKSSDELTKSISKQALANSQLSMSETLTAIKSGEMTASLGIQTIATKLATKAAQGLSTALKFLSGPGGALLIAGITAINIILDGLKRKAEEAKEAVQDSIDTFNNNYDRTQVDTSNFDKLYEEYKKTGVASDELTEAGKQLAEQLGIVGGSALAASGNFTELAGEISNAKEEALLLSDIEANNAINKIAERNESQRKDMSAAWYEDFGQQLDTGNMNVLEDAEDQFFSMNLAQQAGIYREEIRKTNEELDRLNTTRREMAKNPEITQAELDEIDSQITETQNHLTSLQNNYTTFYGDLDKIINPMAELQMEELSAEDFLGLSYEEIADILVGPNSNYEWIRQVYEARGGEAGEAYLNGIIRSMNPEAWAEAQKRLLMQNAGPRGYIGTQANGSTEWEYEGYQDQLNNLFAFGEEKELSNVQLMDIAQFIDWNSPNLDQELANLLQRIRDALKAGVSVDDFIAIEQAGGPEEYLRNITSDQVDNEALQKSALTLYNNNDYMDQYANDLEQVPPLIKEITEAQLRYNEAVEFSTSNMKKWNDTLEDLENGNVNLEDLTDTMEDLRETYKDFLDLNEDVSDRFIRDKKNLKLLEEAIEGNEEAYEDLAEAAAIDIVQHVDVEFDQEKIQEAENAIHTIYDLIDNEEFESLDIGELINVDSFPGLYDSISTLVDYFSAAGMSIQEIQDAILQLTGIYIPTDNFQIAGEEIASSMDNAVAHIEGVVEGVPDTIVDNLSFAQHTTVEDDTATETDQMQYTNLIAEPIEHTKQVILPAGDEGEGKEATARYYDLIYHSETIPTTQQKQTTGQAITSEVTPGPGGKGGVSLKNGSGGSSGWRKGPTGGSKSSGSAAPRSSGGGGGSCFAAGTLISLQNQFKNIEDIQIGDIVLSYNEEIHQNEYSIVLQTMIHDVTEEIYDLYIKDEILTVTGIHRFYVRHKHDIEWIPTSDLHIGDYVLFADGNWHPIFKIKVKVRSLLVYNFEVSHNHNYYVGRNQILAHNKGGGGGGSKAKTIQKKEKKKHEKDYYEEVDSQLDKIKEQLAGIEKQEDRLIGSKARANQQKQIALLNKEIILQKRKLDILQKQEMPETKAKLDKSIVELGDILSKYGLNLNMPKLEYDEDGIISNFEDISRLITDKYNELVDKQGAIADSADEEANKKIEEAMSNFEKAGDKTKDLIQKLNDLQKTQIEWTNAIQESKDAVEDLNIELYKTSLEAIENLKDLNKVHAEFAGFLSGFKSDSPLRALIEDLDELNNSYAVSADRVQEFYNTLIAEKEKAKKSADDDEKAVIDKEIEYFQKKINEAAAGTETQLWANGEVGYYLEALRELRKWMNGEEDEESPNIFGNNAKALYETYLDIYKKTEKSALDYEGMIEDTVEDIIDMYDEVADKQEEFLEKYEHLAKQIERYADLYALTYGEDSYDMLSQIGQQQANVLKSQLNQQWEILRWWDAQIQQAEQEGNQDLLDSLRKQRQEVIDSIGDLAQDSAEAFIDAFEKAVDASTQNILEATFKDKNFDRLDRNWEWDSEYAKKYKDEIEKAYELDSLRNDYMELLNDAQGASLNTQNKIRKQMQEQLELLKDQTTVSQYDIDLANAKLLVLQKQIALEDAQRNKNQMQLRRDSQGNYRYVYRANQDDIAKARKELLDAEYEAYELTRNHAYQTFEDIKNAYDKYLSQRADLLKNFKGTEEELAQQIKEITDAFLRSITGSAEDANDMMAGAVDVLRWMVDNTSEETATAAQNMLNNILDEAGEIKDKTGVIWLDIFDFIKGALGEDAVKVINQANEDSIDSWAALRDELIGKDGILTAINKEITDKDNGYASAVDAATAAIENLNTQTQNLLTDGLKPYNDAIDKNIGQISDWESTLADARATLIELEEDYKRISQIMGEDVAAKNTINIPETFPSTTTPSNNTTTTTTTTTKPATNTNNNKVSEAKAVAAYNWINGGKQGSNSFTNKELAAGQDLINLVYPTSLGGAGWSWDRALQYVLAKSYDTGGYTGEWGKDGKLAVLHQKELVLNAEDTRNILSAVDIVRQMTSTLGNALTNYSIGGARNSLMNSGFGTVDQRVEIKAEFPNVRDAFEIETALTNLADTAYQYAHRKI